MKETVAHSTYINTSIIPCRHSQVFNIYIGKYGNKSCAVQSCRVANIRGIG